MFKNQEELVESLRSNGRRLSVAYFLLGMAIGFGFGRMTSDAMGFVSVSSVSPMPTDTKMNFPSPCPEAHHHYAKRTTEAWVCVPDDELLKESKP